MQQSQSTSHDRTKKPVALLRRPGASFGATIVVLCALGLAGVGLPLPLALAQGLTGLQPEPPTDIAMYQVWGSIKMVTLNAWLRPWPVGMGDDCDCRARLLGRQLKNSDYDVVALNETFSTDISELLDELDGDFPYRVLRRPYDYGSISSGGVSILSRLPLDYDVRGLGGVQYCPSPLELRGWRELVYADCDGLVDDCLADKGVVHVRVWVGAVGWVSIFATHTQANSDCRDAVDARQRQMEELGDFIQGGIDSGIIAAGEPIFIMGDLNMDDSGVFDADLSCSICPREEYARDQFDRALDALSDSGLRGQPIGLAGFYRHNQQLTYDPALNSISAYFWDHKDHMARFDHIIYFPNSVPYHVAPERRYFDVGVAPFADPTWGCSGGIVWSYPFDHLSDHFGYEAKLNFYKYSPPPFPETAPAKPAWVGFNRTADGDAGDGRDDTGVNRTGHFTVSWTLADPYDGGPATSHTLYEQHYNLNQYYWETAIPVAGVRLSSNDLGYGGSYSYRVEKTLPAGISHQVTKLRFLVEACNDAHGCGSQKASEDIWVELRDTVPMPVHSVEPIVETNESETLSARVFWETAEHAEWYELVATSDRSPMATAHNIYQGEHLPAGLVDEDLCAGTYGYAIRACDELECSEWTRSKPLEVSYPDDPSDAPICPAAVLVPWHCGKDCKLNVSWTPSREATLYQLYVSETPDFAKQALVYEGAGTSVSLKLVHDSGTFYFRVKALSRSGSTHSGYARAANGVSTAREDMP
jgi:hypothetical protein